MIFRAGMMAVAVLVGTGPLAKVAAEEAGPAFLTPSQIQATLLPSPPAEGSPEARAELAELQALRATSGPAERAHAAADDKTRDASIFAEAMGPGFDLAALPATSRLLSEVRVEEKAAADAAKLHFLRKRPWIVDPALKPCATSEPPLSSYPSGHTTMGFAMGVVLARLAPSKAAAIMARAEDYGHSRMVCQAHFRSDVVAGQALGTAVAVQLLDDPRFQADFAAAAAELRRAGL